jgi:probable phosphoglycerate mutase
MAEVTKIYLIRHGETLWNSECRMQGHLDSPLTPTGIAQAQALAKRLPLNTFTIIYTSDLGRAYQTAQYLNEKIQLPIQINQQLRERSLGNFQGLTHQEIAQKFPVEYSRFKSLDPDYVVPNGESLKQFRQRCISCFEQLAHRHPGEQILVVTHGGVLVNLFKHTLGLPFEMPRRFEIFNTSVNVFAYRDNHFMLETWGDVSHYQQIATIIADVS